MVASALRSIFVVLLLTLPVPAERVTLSRALELTEQLNPRLQAGVTRTAAAAGQLRTARARPNPEFSYLGGYQYDQPPGGRRFNVNAYNISQPLELGNLRSTRIETARRGLESSELSLAEVRLAILSTVRQNFYQVLRREAEIAIADETLRLVQDLRDRIRVRVDVGEVGRLELIRAEAEVASARSIAANSRIQRLTALAAFRAAVGGDITADLEPAGTLETPAPLAPLDVIKKQVLEKHPALAFYRSEVRRAEAQLSYEQAQRRPQPQLRSEIDQSNPTIRFGFALPIPIFNKREGEIETARALVNEARYLVTARTIELTAAIESAYGRHQISAQEVAALEQGLLREAEEAVRGAQTAYQLGERGILDVLDAQRVLRTVRLNLLNAQFDRQAALIEIEELQALALEGGRP